MYLVLNFQEAGILVQMLSGRRALLKKPERKKNGRWGKPSQNVFSASSHGELCGTNSNTEQTMPHIRGQPSACPGGQPLAVQPPGQGGFHGLSISLGSGAAVSYEEPTLMTVKGQMYQPEKEV